MECSDLLDINHERKRRVRKYPKDWVQETKKWSYYYLWVGWYRRKDYLFSIAIFSL